MKINQNSILKHLHERIAKGESAKDILQISDKYYLDKCIAGYIQFSNILFARIMSDVFTKEEIAQSIIDSQIQIYKN